MKPNIFFVIRIFILLLSLQLTACDSVKKMYEERNDSALAIASRMADRAIPQIGAKCHFTKAWREGKLYYIFSAEPLEDPDQSFDNKTNDTIERIVYSKRFVENLNYKYLMPNFTVRLLDKNGFKLIEINMDDPTRIVDNKSKPTGLQQKSSVECSRQMYNDIYSWDIVWQ